MVYFRVCVCVCVCVCGIDNQCVKFNFGNTVDPI